MKKAILILAGTLAVLFVVAIIGVALFVNPNQFKPRIEAQLAGAVGRPVTIGNVRIAWWSLGVAIDDLSIADDPAFSREPFVRVKSVVVGVDLMPLMLSRTLRVESFRVDGSQIALRRATSGA